VSTKEVFRVPLRERLPNIPIPLRPGEPDAVLQLQPLIVPSSTFLTSNTITGGRQLIR
jgi:hypothetical protein